MKKVILTTIFSVCIPIMVFGIQTNDLKTQNDSARIQENQKLLKVKGVKVFDGNTLLTKSEVLNILSVSPAIAAQYERASKTRTTGTFLLIGGAALFTGGVVTMVNNIDTHSDYYGYDIVEYNDRYYVGLLIGTIGELMIDGGIVCTILGKVKIRKSISNYNKSLNQTGFAPVEVNYQFGLLDNGNFGLKLTF